MMHEAKFCTVWLRSVGAKTYDSLFEMVTAVVGGVDVRRAVRRCVDPALFRRKVVVGGPARLQLCAALVTLGGCNVAVGQNGAAHLFCVGNDAVG